MHCKHGISLPKAPSIKAISNEVIMEARGIKRSRSHATGERPVQMLMKYSNDYFFLQHFLVLQAFTSFLNTEEGLKARVVEAAIFISLPV